MFNQKKWFVLFAALFLGVAAEIFAPEETVKTAAAAARAAQACAAARHAGHEACRCLHPREDARRGRYAPTHHQGQHAHGFRAYAWSGCTGAAGSRRDALRRARGGRRAVPSHSLIPIMYDFDRGGLSHV